MTKKPLITVIGSLTMDLVVKTQRRPIKGETVLGMEFGMVPGGKGANQAVTAAKLGVETYMVGRIGRDLFAPAILENLTREGVNTSHLIQDEKLGTGIAHIAVDGQGDNSIVMVPRANANCLEPDVDAVQDLIGRSSLLLLQLEIPVRTVAYAAKVARRQGVPVILNPAPAQELDDELLANVNYLTPNETEAQILTGIKITDIESAKIAARELHRRGVETVIITLGEKGALLYSGDGPIHIPARKVEVVDTTAAGDAYNGGFAVALAQGQSLVEAAKFASYVGTLAVTKFGAQSSLPSKSEVDDFIAVAG